MEQTISSPEPQQPNGPELVREPRPALKGSADSFVDAAMDFYAEESANKTARRKPTPDIPPGDDGEQAADEAVESRVAKQDRGGAEERDEPALQGEEEEPGEDGLHDDSGSREQPYSVKDLPEDKWIELTIDGKKETVNLAELGKGYIREATFKRRLNKAETLARDATALVKQAQEMPQQLQSQFREFIRNPQEIYDFFTETEERERVLESVARRYAEQRRRHRENPEEGLAWKRQRDERRLSWEREQWEAQRAQQEQAAQRQAAAEHARSIFEPGWAKGLARAGSPKLTPQTHRELMDEVLIRCQQRRNAGEEITSDDIATFVQRAAKTLDLKPGTAQKPKPAPIVPRDETREAPRRGVDWSKTTRRERAKSTDYFLSGLKARDFR